jgi:ribosomal protein S18 acetylase RimI-like enzyme
MITLRRAVAADVADLVHVRTVMRLRPGGDTRGGFLLGTSAEGYQLLVAHARVWVLDTPEGVGGFAVALPDPLVRGSELWQRRAGIVWDGLDPRAIEDARVGYYDQLAVLPRWRAHPAAGALALRALADLFREGHGHVFFTTVRAPVENRAALPFLARVGARRVGWVEERYPEIGPLESWVYHLDQGTFDNRMEAAARTGAPGAVRALRLALDG